jgi:V/A-type H+-transporting ATPase subunit I
MLRPQPCRWFELIAARDDLAAVLATLAATGAVELQAHEPRGAPLAVAGAERLLERFHTLAKTYRAHWPPARGGVARIADPAATLAARLRQLEAWAAQADPLLAQRERLAADIANLAAVGRLLAAAGAALPSPDLLAPSASAVVAARVYALPRATPASDLPAGVLQLTIRAPGEDFLVLVGRAADLAAADEQLVARKAQPIAWPADLPADRARAAREVERRRAALEARQREIERELAALAERHELADALADIALVEWLLRHGAGLAASERLVWVTGWTTARDVDSFCAPLQRAGHRCVVQFSAPPPGSEPPSQLVNPPWIRGFETFARLLGQPGRNEADPSPLVALIAPLLFGFMFGDLGQGALLCAAGWLLRKRMPVLALLIPGGVMAMLFGVLFGSVFAREDLIPAVWLHPLREPVALLAAAIGLGALILAGGLALAALQAHWRGEARAWWARDAGLVVAYAAAFAGLRAPSAWWLVPAGALWFALGTTALAPAGRCAAFAAGLAQFVEQALQLAVNTVSFARVGAFALAHAGLSVAVVALAEASGGVGYWIVLALGNALILALEGLVVGIQTTRLLLFEFFVRFLRGTGRAFKPLPPPLVPSPPGSS